MPCVATVPVQISRLHPKAARSLSKQCTAHCCQNVPYPEQHGIGTGVPQTRTVGHGQRFRYNHA